MKSLFETYKLVCENKKSEEQTLNILKKKGISEEEAAQILQKLISFDDSVNQKNLPFMGAVVSWNPRNIDGIKGVFDDYNALQVKNRIAPMQYVKGNIVMGQKTFSDFLKLSEYIHGEKNKYSEKKKGASYENFEAADEALFSSNGIEVYDGNDVGKCIKYTQGSLTGKGYSFCIGQPANTMYQSYRDGKTSTFYFIVDRNRFGVNGDGSVNLDDPLHIVVFDATEHGIELTDANNTTGSIAEYGENVKGYLSYLKSKGIPIEKMANKAKTPEEEAEQALLGRQNNSLEWFMKLPIEMKSKYIGRGHLLSDEQFNYLLGV